MTTQPTIAGRALTVAAIFISTACDAGSPRGEARGISPSASGPAAAPATSQAATACPNRQIRFGPVRRKDVLTAVAPAVTITSRSGGRLDTELRPVRRYRAEVVAQGDVPQAEIYRAFIGSFGDRAPMPEFGDVAAIEPRTTTVKGQGRFVRYEGVLAVEATFSYSCGPASGRGTVTSWLAADSGVLSCDRRPRPSEPVHKEVAALACLD